MRRPCGSCLGRKEDRRGDVSRCDRRNCSAHCASSHAPAACPDRYRGTASPAGSDPYPRALQRLRRIDRDRRRFRRYRARRVLHDRRPERMRQDDPAAHPRGARIRHCGSNRDRDADFEPAGQLDDLPGRLDISLDDGVEQCGLRPENAPRACRHDQRDRRALPCAHRTDAFRRLLSVPALRRHAPARCHCAPSPTIRKSC